MVVSLLLGSRRANHRQSPLFVEDEGAGAIGQGHCCRMHLLWRVNGMTHTPMLVSSSSCRCGMIACLLGFFVDILL